MPQHCAKLTISVLILMFASMPFTRTVTVAVNPVGILYFL